MLALRSLDIEKEPIRWAEGGIVPLESTRADVENLLGRPKIQGR